MAFCTHCRNRCKWNLEPDPEVPNIESPGHHKKVYKRCAQSDPTGRPVEAPSTSLRVKDAASVSTTRGPMMQGIAYHPTERDSGQGGPEQKAHYSSLGSDPVFTSLMNFSI